MVLIGLLVSDFLDLVETKVEHLLQQLHVFRRRSTLIVRRRRDHSIDITRKTGSDLVYRLDLARP